MVRIIFKIRWEIRRWWCERGWREMQRGAERCGEMLWETENCDFAVNLFLGERSDVREAGGGRFFVRPHRRAAPRRRWRRQGAPSALSQTCPWPPCLAPLPCSCHRYCIKPSHIRERYHVDLPHLCLGEHPVRVSYLAATSRSYLSGSVERVLRRE